MAVHDVSAIEIITKIIFMNGVFGNKETRKISEFLRVRAIGTSMKKLKLRRYFNLIFPSYNEMKDKYCILEKKPVFLPLLWIKRIFILIIFKNKDVLNYLKKNREISNENIGCIENTFQYLGLDTEFKKVKGE